jgi:hypothetical protein
MYKFSGISLKEKMRQESYFLLAKKLPQQWTIASKFTCTDYSTNEVR